MESKVPVGFRSTAHPVFRSSSAPCFHRGAHHSTPTDTTCAVCLHIMVDPVTLVSCVHSFCYPCIARWLRTSNRCPLCKSVVSAFVRSSKDNEVLAWTNPKAKTKLWAVDNGRSDDLRKRAFEVHTDRFLYDHSRNKKRKQENLDSTDNVS
jgi:nitrogen fixation-related uncharacterized protein